MTAWWLPDDYLMTAWLEFSMPDNDWHDCGIVIDVNLSQETEFKFDFNQKKTTDWVGIAPNKYINT